MNRMLDLREADRRQIGEKGRRRTETTFSEELVIAVCFDVPGEVRALDDVDQIPLAAE